MYCLLTISNYRPELLQQHLEEFEKKGEIMERLLEKELETLSKTQVPDGPPEDSGEEVLASGTSII